MVIKNFFSDNRERIKKYNLQNRDRIKDYQLKNHEKIFARNNVCSNVRNKTNIKLCFICKTCSRMRQTLSGKSKSFASIEILGIEIETYTKWIE